MYITIKYIVTHSCILKANCQHLQKKKKKLTEKVRCSLLKSHQLYKFFYSQYYIILLKTTA